MGKEDVHKRARRIRRWLRWLALVLIAAVLSGCETFGYYKQAVHGQYQILAQQRPLSELIGDSQTPAGLREKFQLVLKLREFAERELKLPHNGHYLRYVEVGRRYVVWNVHAAPEFSLEAKTWWYPVVGSLKHRGYFSERDAQRYALKMEKRGWEVYVEGVEAYSTLGWFRDPVLSTFIHHQEWDLAEILFHELAHQRLFVPGDTDFNEAFATAVAEEGVRRWLRAQGRVSAYETYLAGLKRQEQFLRLLMAARQQLESLYGVQKKHNAKENQELLAERKRRKALILDATRKAYAQLKTDWGGFAGYDLWFARSLNNAQLNTVATYYTLAPAFHNILQTNGGDLEKLFEEARRLARLPKAERHRHLAALIQQPSSLYGVRSGVQPGL